MLKHTSGRDMILDYNNSDIVIWEIQNIGRATSANFMWEYKFFPEVELYCSYKQYDICLNKS